MASLCDLCYSVTFNEADADGEIWCDFCLARLENAKREGLGAAP